MKHIVLRSTAILLTLIVTLFPFMITQAETAEDITVLFTHDLHSHFLPSADADGGEFGGYARLMTVINEQKSTHPDAILVDGGDFSMGSLFQTAYPSSATELRLMGQMGYDVTTFGNHEFDYLQDGLTAMLNAATKSGDPLPALVQSNYSQPAAGENGHNAALQEAFDSYGVKEYLLIERGGIYFAVFGIFGYDSDDCAPNSGMILENPAEAAQRTVNKAVADCTAQYGEKPVVVCLSHSGTEDGEGEDYELAKSVNGIDLVISGHTHTLLSEPITVNDTVIVSAGEYGKALGKVTFSRDESGDVTLKEYALIPIDETIKDNETIAKLVQNYKATVENDYLSRYGMTFDEVLTINNIRFDSVKDVYATQHESTLGNVFSDAYKWAVEKTTGEPVDIALTAAGVIRETLPLGNVSVSDVFNAASLGVGTEGELVAVYITGKDLKSALEVDASVQPLMSAAQLFCSGVAYSFNTNRMIFNKVDSAKLRLNDGTLADIDNDKLYRVVTGMYCGQMLGAVESTSMGLLSITPRDKDGNPIDVADLKNYVVYDQNGVPLKEWYAIASYLQQMGGQMDGRYAEPDGRKVVYSSLSPVSLLRNANHFTYIIIGAILLLTAVIILIVRRIVKKRRMKET